MAYPSKTQIIMACPSKTQIIMAYPSKTQIIMAYPSKTQIIMAYPSKTQIIRAYPSKTQIIMTYPSKTQNLHYFFPLCLGCSRPSVPARVHIHRALSSSYSHGASLSFSCQSGYKLHVADVELSSSFVQCNAGHWTRFTPCVGK